MEFEIGQVVKAKHPKTSEIIELTAVDGMNAVRKIIMLDSKNRRYILNSDGTGAQCSDDPLGIENVMWEIIR